MFFGNPHFTVAKLKGMCGKTLAPGSGEAVKVRLKVESTLEPLIVETAVLQEHWEGVLPIAIYPLSEEDGQM